MKRCALVVAYALFVSAPSLAAVTPIGLQRVVRVSAHTEIVDGPTEEGADERVSSEFGLFNEGLELKVSDAGGSASQVSTVSPQQITATGHAAAGAYTQTGDIYSAASAASLLHYEFLVDGDTQFTIVGQVQGHGQFPPLYVPVDSRVTLSRGAEELFFVTTGNLPEYELDDNDIVSFEHVGMLAPGNYALDATVDQVLRWGSEGGKGGSFQFTLTFVPEPHCIDCVLLGAMTCVVVGRRRVLK
ncbi:MAG: hypothetical protein KDB23_23250 [Planctomycetales bacterium]|nr:hypothetical protein [Planctomycetales bacterium]